MRFARSAIDVLLRGLRGESCFLVDDAPSRTACVETQGWGCISGAKDSRTFRTDAQDAARRSIPISSRTEPSCSSRATACTTKSTCAADRRDAA